MMVLCLTYGCKHIGHVLGLAPRRLPSYDSAQFGPSERLGKDFLWAR